MKVALIIFFMLLAVLSFLVAVSEGMSNHRSNLFATLFVVAGAIAVLCYKYL